MTKDVLTCRVAVLAGGWSDERDVSWESGSQVAGALQQAGFEQVELIDVADAEFFGKIASGLYDVAFVAMHGKYGEDGCIQGLLELLHLPYTFSGVLASSLAMEKDRAKAIFREAGIPVAADAVVENPNELSEAELDALVERLGLPLFVKPAGNGSSFGISYVQARDELGDALKEAAAHGTRVLVEAAVAGTEITIPVLGNRDAEALPIIEINTGAAFYDQQVKYEPSELHHIIPARLDAEVYQHAQRYAVEAHRALGCAGCSRSDFIVSADGTPVLLETNTIPGMTAASLLPDSARNAGIEFPELCKCFVELALEKEA